MPLAQGQLIVLGNIARFVRPLPPAMLADAMGPLLQVQPLNIWAVHINTNYTHKWWESVLYAVMLRQQRHPCWRQLNSRQPS